MLQEQQPNTTLACLVLGSAGILLRQDAASLGDLAVLHGNEAY